MTNAQTKKQPDLFNDSVADTLKKMTIPTIYGMIFLMTFNLVDTFFVSLLGTQPLAAISFTFPFTFTVISLTIGLGIGTAAVVGKALGKGDHKAAKDLATSAIILTALIVAALSFFGYLFRDDIFLLLGATHNLLPMISQYMNVWLLGSVLLIGPMIGNAALRATGDTKTPSLIMGSAGLLNAILDPILIFGLGPIPALGLQGAAMATFASWIFGVVVVVYILINKNNLVHSSFFSFSAFIRSGKEMLAIGLPAAGANMLTPIATAILTAIAAAFGESAVAAFGVGSRIEMIACLLIFALSMTLPAFMSQNVGAGKMMRVQQSYQITTKFTFLFQIAIYIILVLLAPFISNVFTEDKAVSQLIELFIWIVPLGYGLQGIIILTNSSFNALHKPMVALVLSFLRLFVFYVPLAYLGSQFYGITGFFAGCLVGNFLMAFVSYALMNKEFHSADFKNQNEKVSQL